MNGVIILDKPSGYTSFDTVAVMRRLCREKKIGHTGTLDPMATGVLPMLLGRATRALPFLADTDKEYEAGFRLGLATDTEDCEGKVLSENPRPVPRERLLEILPRFRGEILQTPPMYSAVSVNGQRLYDLARRGIEVERKSRCITVYRIELTEYDETSRSGKLSVACSKGTYIRTLCADIGRALGTGGIMTSLRRTRAAGFTLADAVTLPQAEQLSAEGRLAEKTFGVETLFPDIPRIAVSAAQSVRFCNGGSLEITRTQLRGENLPEAARLRVASPEGTFLGLAEARAGQLCVLRLFETGEAANDGTV